MKETAADSIDRHIAHWTRELPDLDPHIEGAVTRMQVLVRYLQQGKEAGLAEHGLEGWEYDILWRLRSTGPLYQAAPSWLAEALGTHPATLTGRLNRLEKNGYVVRAPDPADRRRLLVHLTDRGHRAWQDTIGGRATAEHDILDVLTGPEQAQLADLLRRVVLAVEDGGTPLMPPAAT